MTKYYRIKSSAFFRKKKSIKQIFSFQKYAQLQFCRNHCITDNIIQKSGRFLKTSLCSGENIIRLSFVSVTDKINFDTKSAAGVSRIVLRF